MKKIILPIIAATTLTVKATDHITHPNGADHINLPNAHGPEAHQNAYDEFVELMEKFKAFEGQNIFTIGITKNNVEKIFKHIKENLDYQKFQNVIDYTKFLKNDVKFLFFKNFGIDVHEQFFETCRILTKNNVDNLLGEINNFFEEFRNKN